MWQKITRKTIKPMDETERELRREQNRRRRIKRARMQRAILTTAIVSVLTLAVFAVSSHYTKKSKEQEQQYAAVVERVEASPVVEEPVIPSNINSIDGKLYSASYTDANKGFPAEVESKYGILININTRQVVSSVNSKERINPASMTKVLTILTAANHLTTEQLDDHFAVPITATDYSYKHDCTTAGFNADEMVTVRDLFYGTILPSGGEAAAALAIYTAGSMEAFVDMMNEDIRKLGLADTTHVTNMVGIYDENHYSTCYDIAIIMMAAMENDFLADVLGSRTYTTSSTSQHQNGITLSNWFIRKIEDKEFGGRIIGAKTGFVNQSGNCAVSCEAKATGVKYICCTGDSRNGWRCIYDHVAIYRDLAQ